MTTTEIDRGYILASTVHAHAARGWRVESQTNASALLVKGKQVHNGAHAVMTLLTGGLWLAVWLPSMLINRRRCLAITVDAYGNTLVSKL